MMDTVTIRNIQRADLRAVSQLCIDAFNHSVADSLSQLGVNTFSDIASEASFQDRISQNNLIWVAELNEDIVGVIELKERRHVAMLFVKPTVQSKGVGRRLMFHALKHVTVPEVTVSASLQAVPAYKKYGFKISAEVAESSGIVHQPMSIDVSNI